jgi:hypothetical protein
MSQAAREAGIQALRSGDAKTALQHLAEAVRQNPQDVQAYGYLGAAYGQLNMPERAVECLTRATALAPQSAALWFNLGVAQEKAGKRAEAVASLRQALKADPSYDRARQALSRLGEDAGAPAPPAGAPAPGTPAPAAPAPTGAPTIVGDFVLPGASPSAPGPSGPPGAPPAYPPSSPTLQPGQWSPPAAGGPPGGAPGYGAPGGTAPGYGVPPPPTPPPPPSAGPPGGMRPLGEGTPPAAPPAPGPGGPPGGMQPLGDWAPPPGAASPWQPAPGQPAAGPGGPPAESRAAGPEPYVGTFDAAEGISQKEFLGRCYLAGMGMGVWWGLLGAGATFIRSMSLPGSEWGRLLPVILTVCLMTVALGALLYGLIGLLGGSTDDAETTCGNAGMALGLLTAVLAFFVGASFTIYGAALGAFGGFWVSRALGKALGGNINEMRQTVFVVAGGGRVAMMPR